MGEYDNIIITNVNTCVKYITYIMNYNLVSFDVSYETSDLNLMCSFS